jgi:hypothetical protein
MCYTPKSQLNFARLGLGESRLGAKDLEKGHFLIWIYCKPLKSRKTAKTFLGEAWHWNHGNLEILGIGSPKSLEGFGVFTGRRPGGRGALAAGK